MKYRIAVLTLVAVLAVTPAFAQLGSGIVFDPTNYKNAVLRYIQLQQQLQQLQQTYNLYLQQYQFIQNQARQLQDMNARYRAQFSQWRQLASANTYGNTGQWVNGANSGNPTTISSGYSRIVPQLPNYPLTEFSPELQNTLQMQHGTLELQDAANIQSLRTIGEIRGNAQQIETMLSRLENDSLSPDDRQNTQVAVLNKINAGNVVLVRSIQDTNKLLLQLLEQTTQKTTQDRSQQGQQLNDALRIHQLIEQSFAETHQQPASGPFRLP
jgi:hypothetical protein